MKALPPMHSNFHRRPAGLTCVAMPAVRKRGFTLVEMLVVIGIVVALFALAVPMLMRTFREGAKTRVKADLQSISMALEAYKQDFGDYPRVEESAGTGPGAGASILAKALVGPGGLSENNKDKGAIAGNFNSSNEYRPGEVVIQGGVLTYVCVQKTTTPSPNPSNQQYWTRFETVDGASGPGFRTRRAPGGDGMVGTDDDTFQGKVWGPYLPTDKLGLVGMNLYDRNNSPILYFPRNPRPVNVRQDLPPPNAGGHGAYVAPDPRALYDANDNLQQFWHVGDGANDTTNALKRIRALMGDFNPSNPTATTNCDGKIDPGEQEPTDAPFVLWTAGPDGLFGPVRPAGASVNWPGRQEVERCDDITSISR